MKRALLLCLTTTALFADAGIPPRRSSADYPAHQTAGNLTLAAALLTPAEAKKVFTADLDRAGYLVFEVAAYPTGDAPFELSPDQFTLRSANDTAIVPTSSPDSIVEAMYKGKHSNPPQIPGKLDVHETVVIGYETGGGGTGRAGQPRNGGVYGGGATTVGVGNPKTPPPPSTTSNGQVDRDTLLADLVTREFPTIKTASAVAGHLYFAKPQTKPKNGIYQLTFILSGLNGQNIVLEVPVPAKAGK